MSKTLSPSDVTPPVTPTKVSANNAKRSASSATDPRRSAKNVYSDEESLFDDDGVRYTARQKKTHLKHVDFVAVGSDDELDDVDRDLLAHDDEEVELNIKIPKKAAAFHPLYILKAAKFNGNGTVENANVLACLEKRNVMPPGRLPLLGEKNKIFTSPISIVGEILPVIPIMSPKEEVKQYEFLKLVKDGKYQAGLWKREGVVEYRGQFAMLNLAIRSSSSLFNLGSPAKDREWMQMTHETIGQTATPDNGRSWWWIMNVKTPHVKTLMDLVVRNEEFKKAYVEGRRPLVTFTDVTFSYNAYKGVPELQTMYPAGNRPGIRSTIVWTANYKGLGENFATQAVTQFADKTWEDLGESDDECA
jgi:hypothetical protein